MIQEFAVRYFKLYVVFLKDNLVERTLQNLGCFTMGMFHIKNTWIN